MNLLELLQALQKPSKWDNSPLAWARGLPPRDKRGLGQTLVYNLLRDEQLDPRWIHNGQHIKWSGSLIGIRVAFTETNVARFTNADRSPVENIALVVITPDNVLLWIVPAEELPTSNPILFSIESPEPWAAGRGPDRSQALYSLYSGGARK